jgi:hypothetical protein
MVESRQWRPADEEAKAASDVSVRQVERLRTLETTRTPPPSFRRATESPLRGSVARALLSAARPAGSNPVDHEVCVGEAVRIVEKVSRLAGRMPTSTEWPSGVATISPPLVAVASVEVTFDQVDPSVARKKSCQNVLSGWSR